MTAATISNAIRQRFFDEITAGGDGGSALVTSFPNLGCIDGTEAQVDQPSNTTWCELTLQMNTAEQVEIGTDPQREQWRGILFATIRTPQLVGESNLDATIDRVMAAFRRLTTGGVTFYRTQMGPRRIEGPWWRETLQLWWYSNQATTAATP